MDFDNPQRIRRDLPTPRLVIGGALALVGVVLTFDRLGLVDADRVLRFWPVVLIAIGAQFYFFPAEGSRRRARSVNGLIWMGLGLWLLLNSLGAVRVRFWELFWPVILILVGTNLILQTLRRGDDASGSSDRVSMFALLSGVKCSSTAGRLRGGEITGFMGGGQLDLRQATIPPGEVATIDVFAVMAGFEVIVPPHWVVSLPLVPVLGGVDDKRLLPVSGDVVNASGPVPPRLVLRGFLMMGGITLRS